MDRSVKGKTAIVTGAGSGINLCFVQQLLENGCNCLIADLALRPEAQELVKKYSSSTPRAVFQETDVTDWAHLERMFDVAEKEFGEIDIVCPGAGIFEPKFSSFWYPPGSPESKDSPSGSRYALIDVNIVHPIRTTQLAISRFANAKTPKTIIHCCSIAAQGANFSLPTYMASKHAISGFVRSLAKLDQIGIRVAAVAPGYIKTPLWTDSPDKMVMIREDKEWVTPEDVATVMLALVEKEEIHESFLDRSKPNEGARITIEGGAVVEVSKSVRKVGLFNDPGPVGRAGNNKGSAVETDAGFLKMIQSGTWGKPGAN
ncbi:hypothetical protein FQN57_007221 [Myotisia sp. PD_48]|nr:hypothetical protein FQN57_007221 [Myotisia sp. PD_48]